MAEKTAEAQADEKKAAELKSANPANSVQTAPQSSNSKRAVITDAGKSYSTISDVKCLDWSWATNEQKNLSGAKGWEGVFPKIGDEGEIMFRTKHCFPDIYIVILKVGKYYVPMDEKGIRRIN